MNQPPSSHTSSLFHGRHFDRSIIILCVHWYITYKLSYRDLVEMMAERGVDVSHTTILRWVQRYVPEFERRWRRYARPVGTSWRVDETYIKVAGRWTYLYRAVDRRRLTVDFLLSEHRDIAAAKQFFTRAVERHGTPETITLDGYPATHAAVVELKKRRVLRPKTKVWTSKYLNNIVEQDHRRVKQRIYPMLGFKTFVNATTTISGIELTQKIKKGQFDIEKFTRGVRERAPQVWVAVLAA
ncbi:MAG: IS6 family transposase [Acidobacteria bacterium]|nr:IS6 family transposase [Acidobacteriota bacterium]